MSRYAASGIDSDNGFITSAATTLKTFTTDTGVQVTGAGSTGVVASEQLYEGNDTLKVTTGAGVTTEVILSTAFSQDFNNQTLGWIVYVEDPDDITNFVVYEGGAGWSPLATETYTLSSHDFAGWHFVPGVKDLFGGTIADPLVNTKLRITPAGAAEAVIHVAAVHANWRTRAKVMISFDDSLASQYTIGLPELTSRGFKGTFGIIRGGLDVGEMTTAQVKALHAAGHSIAIHGATSYVSLGVSAAETEALAARQFLQDNNLTGAENFVIYPNGAYDTDTINMLKGNGFEAARCTINAVAGGYGLGLHTFGWGADSKFEIPIIGHQAANSVANVKLQIDYMIAQGATGVLMYHDIVAAGAAGAEVNTADYQAIMTYLKDKENEGLLDVVSYEELKSIKDNGHGRFSS